MTKCIDTRGLSTLFRGIGSDDTRLFVLKYAFSSFYGNEYYFRNIFLPSNVMLAALVAICNSKKSKVGMIPIFS